MRGAIGVVILTMTVSAGGGTASAGQANPKAEPMEGPNIKVLHGLTVPEFDAEMKYIVEALGVSCAYCHVRNNFASEDNAHKIEARRMLEMTRTINQQYFPDFKPGYDESRIGKITCYTCHQGSLQTRTAAAGQP